jgi:hypothetical protein
VLALLESHSKLFCLFQKAERENPLVGNELKRIQIMTDLTKYLLANCHKQVCKIFLGSFNTDFQFDQFSMSLPLSNIELIFDHLKNLQLEAIARLATMFEQRLDFWYLVKTFVCTAIDRYPNSFESTSLFITGWNELTCIDIIDLLKQYSLENLPHVYRIKNDSLVYAILKFAVIKKMTWVTDVRGFGLVVNYNNPEHALIILDQEFPSDAETSL